MGIPALYHSLESYIQTIVKEYALIQPERKETLLALTDYIRLRIKNNQAVKLIFICTHNSRRSHISQIWAQVAAFYFGIPEVETFSGGTEATAFNPKAVDAIQRAGFKINKSGERENPLYLVKFGDSVPAIKAFSKVYDQESNPAKNFAAIMTCSQADEACPFIAGADKRMPIPYDDPKEFDGTAYEAIAYDERTRQIARELFYAFSLVKV